MLLQQADNNPLAVADYELRRNHLLATNIQANTFVEELKKRLGADIEIRIVNHISRGKQHISVFEPKSLVVDIYVYELAAISRVREIIEDTRRSTDLDRSVEILVKANNSQLIFLDSLNGFEQAATLPVLRQTGIDLDHLLEVNPHLVWEIAAIAARNDCRPVKNCHSLIAKLYELEHLHKVLLHQVRVDVKLFHTELVGKQRQRITLLFSSAKKELDVRVYLKPALDLTRQIDLKLFKTVGQVLQACQQFDGIVSTVELETHSWTDDRDPGEALKVQFLQAIDSARQSCIISLGHCFHTIVAFLLANSNLTLVDITAVLNSENPPLAYKRDKEAYSDQIDEILKENNERLTTTLFETLNSTDFRPLTLLGNWAAHEFSTLRDHCALCAGNCYLKQQPRAVVTEDAWQYSATLEVLGLLKTKEGSEKALTIFLNGYLPFDPQVTLDLKSDIKILGEFKAYAEAAFRFATSIGASDHQEGEIETYAGLQPLQPHRGEDFPFHVNCLHFIQAVIQLHETPRCKNKDHLNTWLEGTLSHLVNNIIGTKISTRARDEHQLSFVKALKGQLFKTIQTRWEQWESEINPHRLDEYSNTKKYRILYRICKAAVNLLDKQLVKANLEPLEHFHSGLTVLARVYIDFFNDIVSYNADLIQADLTFARDKQGFIEAAETKKGIYIKLETLGTNQVPPEPEGPPPGELTAEGLPDEDEDDILHLVDQEVTKVEHEKINLVDQTDSAHLKLPEGNTRQLARAFGFTPIPFDQLSIEQQPVAVACATALLVEGTSGDTRRELSPISRELEQPESTRQRTDDGFFIPWEDEPEADRHENEHSCEETVADTVANAYEASGQEDVRNEADASRDHGVLTEFFGSDYEDSSDLESLGSDSSEGFDEESDDIPLE